MALSTSVLSGLIRTKMLAKGAPLNAQDGQALTDMCDAIAEAVVQHVTGDGVVLPTLLVAPNGGGPVTGTGTIT